MNRKTQIKTNLVQEVVYSLNGHLYRLKYDDWEDALEHVVCLDNMNLLAFNLIISAIIDE